jgi:hypothetical protein
MTPIVKNVMSSGICAEGLKVRDYIAIEAMKPLIEFYIDQSGFEVDGRCSKIAMNAYKMADYMIEKSKENNNNEKN